jgi:hypothetical protein
MEKYVDHDGIHLSSIEGIYRAFEHAVQQSGLAIILEDKIV